MNIAIVGFARQGKSTYDYLKNSGHNITICDRDTDTEVPEDCQAKLGEDYLANLDGFDQIYRTSAIHPQKIADANPQSPDILDKVTSNTNEFFHVCPTKNIVGVTGTKGKSTTSTLIAKLLEQNGFRVHLGGNIGISPLDLLENNIQSDDWVVLELANFQLIDVRYSPHIAVVLMISDEHLDWHHGFDEYLAAKSNIFKHQKARDIAIYYANNKFSQKCAAISAGAKLPFGTKPGAYVNNDNIMINDRIICRKDDIKLPGEHNIENICAAITVAWQIYQDIDKIRDVITNFSGLPYRLEKRRLVNGVTYYNDSYASNPAATIAAINSIKQTKVIIVGGKDRGLALNNLAQSVKQDPSIKKVIIIGEAATRIANCLSDVGFDNYVNIGSVSMDEIISSAKHFAADRDAIVLSPGFPSFDMFTDFEDRGQQFNEIVDNL